MATLGGPLSHGIEVLQRAGCLDAEHLEELARRAGAFSPVWQGLYPGRGRYSAEDALVRAMMEGDHAAARAIAAVARKKEEEERKRRRMGLGPSPLDLARGRLPI